MEGIVASRNYYPGDVIYSEPAFAKVVPRKLKDKMCEFCGTSSEILRACKECSAVKYCGKNCQKRDWSSHKFECKRLKNLTEGSLADFVRLTGKVIWKIQGRDWKLIKTKVLGREFSFDDIDSNYTYMVEDPRMVLLFNEVKELTGKYIGFDNLPDDDSLIKIIGKVKQNVFRLKSYSFFIGASMFNMECIPNANASLCGNKLKIWTCKKIQKEKDKITIPGRKILLPVIRFADDNAPPCKCSDCSKPYGDSILSKIVDKKRAFTVLNETETFLNVDFLNALEKFDDFMLSQLGKVVDHLLLQQENVLGSTNHLRIALLAVRCLHIGGHPVRMKKLLTEMEKSMRSVFGEYYEEILPVYKALSVVNFETGNPFASLQYVLKANAIEQLLKDDEEK